jgi:flavin reductase (DIM6/NTAB) family NADH-FMN oxidoreductase RutF
VQASADRALPTHPQCATPPGTPQVPALQLRTAMGSFATGVTVVTCGTDQGLFGFTANSFQCVSLEPPLVSFCLAKDAWSIAAFAGAAGYAVSVLAAGQQDLALRFSRRGGDKWAGVDYHVGHGGAPVLSDSIASFECSPVSMIEAGDHLIFLARVERVCHRELAQPLLFFRGQLSGASA